MPIVEIRGNGLSAQVTVAISQDRLANRSTLRISALYLRNDLGATGQGYVNGTISIGGSQAANLGCGVGFDKNSWSYVDIRSAALYPVTVSHNSDGTCPPVSVSVNLYARNGSGNYNYGTVIGSGTVSVPTIPRATGISANGVTLGSPMTVSLSRASSDFRDTVSWQCGGETGVIAEKTGETTLSWTPTVSLASQNTQGTTVDVILTVTTYAGDTAIGSKSVTVRCTIPDSVTPTLSIDADDKTGCLQKYGCFVRSRSQARIRTAASGIYGSSITNIAVSCGGLTGTGAEAVFSLPHAGAVSVRVTVTDSRGRTASASGSITVADYKNPSASITGLYRCDADGTANPQGAYGKAVFSGAVTALGGKNSAGYRLKKRIRGTEDWEESELTGYTGQFTPQGETVFSAGVDHDFEICVSASDDFTEVSGSVTVLPVAFSLLDFHRGNKSVGILQRAATSGAVDVGGDTVHHGNRIRDVGAPENPGDAVTLGYLQEYVDGMFPVPIEKGGTGAGTLEEARRNLGITEGQVIHVKPFVNKVYCAHGKAVNLTYDIALEGYTPLSMMAPSVSGGYSTFFNVAEFYLNGNTASVSIRNLYSAADGDVSVTFRFSVLYVKNSSEGLT